ncbi:MAG: polysaccharide deacetylase family protein [Saprospiraceae bacterium]|jgi:peptidoglycan/xylan/chitin deacetylase (PgdA/CDA1 family)|nr:polysaccharide deacetylase family protein [Saprospiraceae bacterium]
MIKQAITLSLCLLSILSLQAQKEMCITIDDLPAVTYGKNEQKHLLEITNALIQTFDQYQIPAIGYVNERKLYMDGQVDEKRIALLELWLENGYEIGNHTFSHPSYDRVSFEEFTKDILKGEKITRPLVKKYNQELRFFRHPYLRIGNTIERHDSLVQFLAKHHYTEAPVSIDNEDYLFAKAYFVAYKKGDQELMQKIGEDYVQYMENKVAYFEQSADSLFQRPIKQILLLHANLINAHYLDELAEMYQKKGYRFISQADAIEDPAYQSKIYGQGYGPWGISWLDRWALSRGKKGTFFKDDPRTPEYIQELAR